MDKKKLIVAIVFGLVFGGLVFGGTIYTLTKADPNRSLIQTEE
jgi:hypothetical protein